MAVNVAVCFVTNTKNYSSLYAVPQKISVEHRGSFPTDRFKVKEVCGQQ